VPGSEAFGSSGSHRWRPPTSPPTFRLSRVGDADFQLSGGFGSDHLLGDTDICGTEADVAIADPFDSVNPDCETVLP
jgi:hypothetical protein